MVVTFCGIATATAAQETVTYYRLKDKNEPTKGYLLPPAPSAQSLIFQPCDGNAFEVTSDQIEQTTDTCGGPPGTLSTFDPKALIGAPVYTWNKDLVGKITSVDKAGGEVKTLYIGPENAQTGKSYEIPAENFDFKKTGNNYEVMYLKGIDALFQDNKM